MGDRLHSDHPFYFCQLTILVCAICNVVVRGGEEVGYASHDRQIGSPQKQITKPRNALWRFGFVADIEFLLHGLAFNGYWVQWLSLPASDQDLRILFHRQA